VYQKSLELKNKARAKEFQQKMDKIMKKIIKIDEEDREAKAVQSTHYHQDFDLYNLVGLLRNSKNFKPMTEFEFRNLLKKVVENFSDIIEKSEKLK